MALEKPFSLTMTARMLEAIKQAADETQRSQAGYVRYALEEQLRRDGHEVREVA